MLQEKERLQQEEISKLDQQLEQRRRKLCKMEEMEVQLKAQLKSLTRREGGSGSGGGGSRDRHQFGHQSPNSSLLHSGQHHGQHRGQHHGQQWIGNNLPGGRSPGDEPWCMLAKKYYF